MTKKIRVNAISISILVVFIGATVVAYILTRRKFFLFDLPYIGFSIFAGMTLSRYLPGRRKQVGRRISQFLVGVYLIMLAVTVNVDLQMEGVLFQICSLTFGGVFVHNAVAKIAGPAFFGRGFCGWACWNAMVFDLLPWTKSPGRVRYFGIFRYLHLILVCSVVSVLFFIRKYDVAAGTVTSLRWFCIGNAIYFLSGITMALILKDNRAFCKYLCPIPPVQKVLAGFSVIRFNVDPEKCTECHACERACPMDIKILDYKHLERRVESTECILCNACGNVCPTGAIASSMKVAAGRNEFLNIKNKKH